MENSITRTCTPVAGGYPGRLRADHLPAGRFRSPQGVHARKKNLERLSSLFATRIQKLWASTSGCDRPSCSFSDFLGYRGAHSSLSLACSPLALTPRHSSYVFPSSFARACKANHDLQRDAERKTWASWQESRDKLFCGDLHDLVESVVLRDFGKNSIQPVNTKEAPSSHRRRWHECKQDATDPAVTLFNEAMSQLNDAHCSHRSLRRRVGHRAPTVERDGLAGSQRAQKSMLLIPWATVAEVVCCFSTPRKVCVIWPHWNVLCRFATFNRPTMKKQKKKTLKVPTKGSG